MIPRIAAVLLFTSVVYCIPVDNGIEGEPEIECGPTSITVNFNTRNPFEGHIYVKGLYNDENCRKEETGGRSVAGIELPFDTCNVQRTRSLNPRGIFVTTTVVVSFHPQFVTKVDRMYRLQCFYMEADKTVSTDLSVSDLTTPGTETAIVPMPVCRYELHEGSPDGPLVHFGFVGQQIYHRWVCDSETTDTFCMVVNTCTVDDGKGEKIQIIDEKGCALDKFVLNNLEYPTDLSAGQEAHVYKFADRPDLFYQCQIAITIKEPNQECPRPQCEEPTGFNTIRLQGGVESAGAEGTEGAESGAEAEKTEEGTETRRVRRSANENADVLDVRAELSAMNIMDDETTKMPNSQPQMHPSGHQIVYRTISEGFCMSSFATTLVAVIAFAAASIMFSSHLLKKEKESKC